MPGLVDADVLDLFLALAAIESPPGRERGVADACIGFLRDLGLEPDEDDAGPAIGSEIGNVFCALPPRDEGGTPIFLCAHLDTVPPTAPVEPVVVDGRVTNRNDAILGGDNKAAVAAMLAAVREIVRRDLPHAGVELILTPMEEVGLQGAKRFDVSRLRARTGYVYDHAAPIGDIVLAAPTQRSLELRFHGRPAHAGIEPEKGRSAIVAAANAIAQMELGRIDSETTANVGLIEGGVAKNIVAPTCTVWVETRSREPGKVRASVQAILDASTHAANLVECELETRIVAEYDGYRFSRRDPAVRLAATAIEAAGFTPRYGESGGGADANVFNAAGLVCVNLCNGMTAIHTGEESIAVEDLGAMTRVTLELVEAARAA